MLGSGTVGDACRKNQNLTRKGDEFEWLRRGELLENGTKEDITRCKSQKDSFFTICYQKQMRSAIMCSTAPHLSQG